MSNVTLELDPDEILQLVTKKLTRGAAARMLMLELTHFELDVVSAHIEKSDLKRRGWYETEFLSTWTRWMQHRATEAANAQPVDQLLHDITACEIAWQLVHLLHHLWGSLPEEVRPSHDVYRRLATVKYT